MYPWVNPERYIFCTIDFTFKTYIRLNSVYHKMYFIITLRWLNPLLGLGYKKDLDIEDIFENLKSDGSDELGERLQR